MPYGTNLFSWYGVGLAGLPCPLFSVVTKTTELYRMQRRSACTHFYTQGSQRMQLGEGQARSAFSAERSLASEAVFGMHRMEK